MPKLWTDTVATHREEVRQAVLDAAGQLVARDGLWAVSMSRLAEVAGIGRATLYKYFADVEEVLAAWHARQVSAHLADLAAVAAGPGRRRPGCGRCSSATPTSAYSGPGMAVTWRRPCTGRRGSTTSTGSCRIC